MNKGERKLRSGNVYYGDRASKYESHRETQPTWAKEEAAVRLKLSDTPNATVLDIPVGTGRFLKFYEELGISCVGVDISHDMLFFARQKGTAAKLKKMSALQTNFQEQQFDWLVCVRFTQWMNKSELIETFQHLIPCCKNILFTVRISEKGGVPEGHNDYSHTESGIAKALQGFKIIDRITLGGGPAGKYEMIHAVPNY